MLKSITTILCFVSVCFAATESLEMDTARVDIGVSNHSLLTSTNLNQEDGASPQLLRSETALRAEYGKFTFGTSFSNRVSLTQTDGLNSPIALEKKSITFESDEWKVVAGDSHQEIGRGIALSLFRDDTFGIDNTLEGLSVKFTPENWEAFAFGGRVHSFLNPVALLPMTNPLIARQVFLFGGGLKRKFGKAAVGMHYLQSLNQPAGGDINLRRQTVGAVVSADQFAPDWDFYAESNLMQGRRLGIIERDLPEGYGSYASLVYAPSSWKWKLDFKDYRDFGYDFHRPPTMEEDIVTVLNFSDVTTARFTAERRIGAHHSIRAAVMAGEDRTYNGQLYQGVVAGKWKAGRVAFESRLGHRLIHRQNYLTHGDLKAKIPTRAGQTLELGYRKMTGRSGLSSIAQDEDRNFFDLGYTFSAYWSLNAGYEFVPSYPNSVGKHFGNVGLLAKYDAFTGRALVGSTSGGPQCSGGICRLVPAYSGVMVDTTYSF